MCKQAVGASPAPRATTVHIHNTGPDGGGRVPQGLLGSGGSMQEAWLQHGGGGREGLPV